MKWSQAEIEQLSPILERVQTDLGSPGGRDILVLCSAGGDVAIWLAQRLKPARVVGLELDETSLQVAQRLAEATGLTATVEFRKAEKTRVPFPNDTFDALVSEFIVFPTPAPTEIGQREMARVLKPGGKMILTDVIVTRLVPAELRAELQAIGLDYLCDATVDDFLGWMKMAGLTEVEVMDLTPVVEKVWRGRRERDAGSERGRGYSLLLEDAEFGLGKAIFYVYIRGTKPTDS